MMDAQVKSTGQGKRARGLGWVGVTTAVKVIASQGREKLQRFSVSSTPARAAEPYFGSIQNPTKERQKKMGVTAPSVTPRQVEIALLVK